MQELVPLCGYDLRIIVAAGRVVGAIERVAAARRMAHEHRARRLAPPTDPPPEACELAVAAAAALGGDLVGVDLLPDARGGWTVLEINGAVDFTHEYSLDGGDVFAEVAQALSPAHLLETAVSMA